METPYAALNPDPFRSPLDMVEREVSRATRPSYSCHRITLVWLGLLGTITGVVGATLCGSNVLSEDLIPVFAGIGIFAIAICCTALNTLSPERVVYEGQRSDR